MQRADDGGSNFIQLDQAVALAVADLQDEWVKLTDMPTYVHAPGTSAGMVREFSIRATTLKNFTKRIGSFYLEQVPSCCGLVILQHVSGDSSKHGQSPSLDLTLKTAMLASKLAGYTYVQYTSTPNQYLDEPLKQAGFKAHVTFKSVRTGNLITVWLRDLYLTSEKKENTKKPRLIVQEAA